MISKFLDSIPFFAGSVVPFTIISFFGVPMYLTAQTTDLHGRIDMSLSIDKASYIPGEIVFVHNTITNLSSQDLEIPRPLPDAFLVVHMIDAGGGKVRGGYPQVFWAEPPSILIPSRSKRSESINLSSFGNTRENTLGVKHLLTGKYKVWVELAGVSSNTIELTIKPLSERDRELSDTLAWLFRSNKSSMEAISAFSTFIEQNHKSPYVPNAYRSLMTFLFRGREKSTNERLKSVCLEFMKSFPNHGISWQAVQFFRLILEREAGKKKGHPLDPKGVSKIQYTLREMQKEFTNTRTYQFISDAIAESAAGTKKE